MDEQARDSREGRLVAAFVELADTVVDDFDVVDFLYSLTARAADLLDAQEAGVMVSDQRGKLRVVAATSEQTRLLELFELQNDEGPCLDCFSSGRPVGDGDLTRAEQRWPRFAEKARAEGYQAVHALPMRLREQIVGALNLFCTRQARLSDSDLQVGQALADVATIGLLQHRTNQHRDLLTEQLQTALTSRVVIEQAKGMLAQRLDISMDQAFTLLRQHARDHQQPLSDAARSVVDGTADPDYLDLATTRPASGTR